MFHHTVEIEGSHPITMFQLGNVTVQGIPIVAHASPQMNEAIGYTDSLFGAYSESSGINQSTLRVFLNGIDRSTRIVAKTSSSFKVRLDSLPGGTYAWKSYVCANAGRCDSLTTSFVLIGATNYALDDSLPATYTESGTALLLGPLPDPPVLRGCPNSVGDPLIYFSSPQGFVTQTAPYGQAHIANIDTTEPYTTVTTTSQAWRTDSKTCDQIPQLSAAQFDYGYFGAYPANDPHWMSYEGAFAFGPVPDLTGPDWLREGLQLALGPTPPGPRVDFPMQFESWGGMLRAPEERFAPIRLPRHTSAAVRTMGGLATMRLPEAGPIDPATFKLTLNGTVIVDHAVAQGNGVIVDFVHTGFQKVRVPISHPSYRTTMHGGWNEMVATISDSQGHTVSSLTRFVHEAGALAGPVAPLMARSLRDFTHADQEDCAAFGPFQCGGVTLSYPLPGFVTRDRERSVHLIYRSASQRVSTILPLQLDILAATKAPDSLWVTPRIGAALDTTKRNRYAGVLGAVSGPNATNIGEGKDEQRIVSTEIPAPATGVVTINRVTSLVRSWFRPSVGTPFRDDSVSQDVVQVNLTEQAATRFGQGWQLAELGRLVLTNSSGAGLQFNGATAAVWLSGDGSYAVFRKPSATWISPPGQTARLVVEAVNGSTYVMYLETGASIGFRADGWQVWTRDLVGNFTTFAYHPSPSNQLDSITDPTGKSIKFSYYSSGKRSGYAQYMKLNVRGTSVDSTVTVFQYDTVSNPSAVRLSRIQVLTTPTDTSTTRFSYFGGAAPGAFIDSVIDPRHTTSKPVVTRFRYNAALWTPEQVTDPVNQVDQYRSLEQRSAPRVGYGRPLPGNPLERTIALVQYIGTFAPFGTNTTDFTVDRFGAPDFVRKNGANPSQGSVASDETRHIVRDSLSGVPLRIVHNRYAPTMSDSVVFHYDALWRVDTLKRTTLAYQLTGQSRTLDTLTFKYDSVTLTSGKQWCSRLIAARDAMGGRDSVEYGSPGLARCLPKKVVTKAGEATQFGYGALVAGQPWGTRPVSVIDPAALKDSVAYDPISWNSAYHIRKADNATTLAFYNRTGRADSILDPVGVVTRVRNDRWGRASYQQTGSGPATHSIFDKGGLVTQVEVYQPDGEDLTLPSGVIQTTATFYNQLGQMDSLVGAGGRQAAPNGFRARKQSWSGFDRFGNPHWSYGGNGAYVSRIFDGQGRVTQTVMSAVTTMGTFGGESFASSSTVAWLNNFQIPIGKVQNSGATHTYTYDDKGRLATTKSRDLFLPDPDFRNYNPDYVTQSYVYSKSDELITATTAFHDGAAVVRRYEYNRRGQRTQAVDSSFGSGIASTEVAGTIRYVYDSATARLDSIVAFTGIDAVYAAVSFQYDSYGRPTGRHLRSRFSGMKELATTMHYDVVGQLDNMATANTTGGTPWYSASGITYNKVGDITAFNSNEPGVGVGNSVLAYTTDGTRRLLSTQKLSGTLTLLSKWWTYDFWGNRLTENGLSSLPELTPCLGSRTSTYDKDNRVITRGTIAGQPSCGQSLYYADNAGNRLGDADLTYTGTPVTQLRSLSTYTAANQLYFSMTPSGTQTDMNWNWYDAQGRRAEAQNSSWSAVYLPVPHPDSVGDYRTYYIYDGNDVALELTRNQTSKTWRVDRRLLSGGIDAPLAGRFWITSGYKNLGFVTDRSGTIVAAIDSTGAQELSAVYFPRDAFGALVGVTGSGGQPLGGVGFTGAGTPNARGGFTYLRNRWYDPQTGRFLTQDPLGLAGGVNLYAYAGNNPISFSDPFGLMECPPDCPPGEGPAPTRAAVIEQATSNANKVIAALTLLEGAGRLLWGWTGKALVSTSRGAAVQDGSSAAFGLRTHVAKGGQIFRGGNFGASTAAEGQFWATESPLAAGFASRVGAATLGEGTPQFVLGGSVAADATFVTRVAPAVGRNPGGALEVVVPSGSVNLDFFHMP